jgi:alpha-L-rhamnosidase
VTVKLPFDLKPGTWHQIKTTIAGTSLTVSIDGQQVASFIVSATDLGSVGFFNQDGADALFRDLSVTDAGGHSLYLSSLTDPRVLPQFAAGTNVLPVLVDGAKRDRLVWIGDMSLEPRRSIIRAGPANSSPAPSYCSAASGIPVAKFPACCHR